MIYTKVKRQIKNIGKRLYDVHVGRPSDADYDLNKIKSEIIMAIVDLENILEEIKR